MEGVLNLEQLDSALQNATNLPSLWLRDDDIVSDSPNFRLLSKLGNTGIPLVFAAVPYRLKFSDAELSYVNSLPNNVYFCVHGYNHANNAAEGTPSEYPASADATAVRNQMQYGHKKISSTFGNRFLPMFVPPWNSFSPQHMDSVIESGYRYISGSYERTIEGRKNVVESLPCHVDVLDYPPQHPYPLKTNESVIEELASAVSEWQESANTIKPICILSHHSLMTREDVARYSELIEAIAPRFAPYDIAPPHNSD